MRQDPVPSGPGRPSSGLDNFDGQAGEGPGGRLCQSAKGGEGQRGTQPKQLPHGHLWCYRCHEIHHFLRFRDDWRERSQYRGYKSIFCIDCDRAYKREYREKNKAKVRKWNLKWCAANKPALRASRIARRTKEGPATREQIAWMSVLRADPCGYCGGPGGSVDHIVAVARGGRFDEDNLSGACRRCNASKGAMPLVAWLMLRRD